MSLKRTSTSDGVSAALLTHPVGHVVVRLPGRGGQWQPRSTRRGRRGRAIERRTIETLVAAGFADVMTGKFTSRNSGSFEDA